MRKFLYLAISTMFLIFLTTYICFAVPDTCLTLLWPDDGINYNPDFICIDTCKDSPTYGDWYQRGTWTIGFKKFIFRDSIESGDEAYVKDIDSIHYPEFYSAFKIIEEKFGFLTFHRAPDVCNNRYDYTFYIDPCLNVFFDRRSRTIDIESYLKMLPDIKFVWMTNYPVKSDVIENKNINISNLYPNPCTDKLNLLNLYNLNINQIISIYNYLGIPVLSYDLPFETNTFEIDVSYLIEGIYFIKINNNLLKFIKLR